MGAIQQLSRESVVEEVRLITKQSVTVVQASRHFDVHEKRLKARISELPHYAQHGFQGKVVIKTEQAEIEWPHKDVAKLKMERDILKKLRPSSPSSRYKDRLCCETPMALAVESDERGARCLTKWFL